MARKREIAPQEGTGNHWFKPRRYAHGAPHIPGCFVFMLGLNSAIPEKPSEPAGAYRRTDDDTIEEGP